MREKRRAEASLRVAVCDRQSVVPMPHRRVRALARAASPANWHGATVSIVLVDGREMTALNGRFTGRTGDTDVLAFDLSGGDDGPVGEVIVNATRAAAEARARAVEPQEEMALYIAHGLIHLQGFDDHTAKDRQRMYAREAEVLAAAGWPCVRPARRRSPRGGSDR